MAFRRSNRNIKKPTTQNNLSSMKVVSWTEGDLVWARVSGYPYWPGIVVAEPNRRRFIKDGKVHVQFYGDKGSHCFLEQTRVRHFDKNDQLCCSRWAFAPSKILYLTTVNLAKFTAPYKLLDNKLLDKLLKKIFGTLGGSSGRHNLDQLLDKLKIRVLYDEGLGVRDMGGGSGVLLKLARWVGPGPTLTIGPACFSPTTGVTSHRAAALSDLPQLSILFYECNLLKYQQPRTTQDDSYPHTPTFPESRSASVARQDSLAIYIIVPCSNRGLREKMGLHALPPSLR
uniref:PWWP domain-containing protein n=1 Tax=Timema douglasi TaxID=61478 RepID=A0A7R8VKA2_TIMDO|nr:unnamed protein product [Timema douglasi]